MSERGDRSKDRSEHWLLTRHAGSILRLAKVSGFTSWVVEESKLGTPQRLPDGIVCVTFADRPQPLTYLVEIETYANTDADRQMFEDLLLARIDRGVIPEGILVVLRPKGNVRSAGRFEATSELGTSRVGADWKVVELWTLAATDLLAENDVGLVPWVPLCRIDGPAEPVLRECRTRIDRDAPLAERDRFLAATEILAGLVHPAELLADVFQGELPMIESPTFARWEARTTHRNLMKLLTARFATLPADMQPELRKVYNLDSLDQLIQAVLTTPSPDDFLSLVRSVPKE